MEQIKNSIINIDKASRTLNLLRQEIGWAPYDFHEEYSSNAVTLKTDDIILNITKIHQKYIDALKELDRKIAFAEGDQRSFSYLASSFWPCSRFRPPQVIFSQLFAPLYQ